MKHNNSSLQKAVVNDMIQAYRRIVDTVNNLYTYKTRQDIYSRNCNYFNCSIIIYFYVCPIDYTYTV